MGALSLVRLRLKICNIETNFWSNGVMQDGGNSTILQYSNAPILLHS